MRAPSRPMASAVRSRWLSALTALALALLGTVVIAPAAQAAGTPDIQVDVAAPAEALRGSTFPITVTATNPAGPHGYNATFRVVLPTGTTLDAAGTPIAPTAGPFTVPGGQAYVWSNLSDLLTGISTSLTVSVDTGSLPLSTLTFDAGVYVNSDPRLVPDWTSAGAVTGDVTGQDEASGATELVPFTLTKETDSPEKELARGVHDHRTWVALTIDNNLISPSNSFSIVDYIPAELEFLGCGVAGNDNSAGPEYPGSGPLNATTLAPAGDCPTPTSIATQQLDPDGAGPLPTKVYTVVTWNTAALATVGASALGAAGSHTIHYVVGIPQRANALFAAAPAPTSLLQGSNLTNNTGVSTIETGEQIAQNLAVLSGTYTGDGGTYSDDDIDQVTLEDLAIQKSERTNSSPDGAGSLVQGSVTVWNLTVETSEYTSSATGLTVTDTVPDGLRVTATSPTATSVVEQSDGSTVVTWSGAAMAAMGRSETRTLTMTTQTRPFYRTGFADDTANPIRAMDSWTNEVAITGTATEVVAGVNQTPRTVQDVSSASQQAAPIELRKYVSRPAANGTCGDGTLAGMTWQTPLSSTTFGPGDHVCWKIDISTPTSLDTTNTQLSDFLPAAYTYVTSTTGAGSVYAFPAPTVSAAGPSGQSITWDLGGIPIQQQGTTATVIVESVIAYPTQGTPGDLKTNLAKLVYRNTSGEVFQLRDAVDAPWREPVLLNFDKSAATASAGGLTALNGADTVTYTLTVPNIGNQDAVDVQIWDNLPPQLGCAAVTGAITPSSAASVAFGCAAGRISGSIARIPAGTTATVQYTLTVPSTVNPGVVMTNTAGVRHYRAETDISSPTQQYFDYYPSSNIDPTVTPNTGPASDAQSVTVQAIAMTKTASSPVEDGNTSGQATIGEVVTYRLTATVPHGTTSFDATIVDTLPAGMVYLGTTSATCTAPVGCTVAPVEIPANGQTLGWFLGDPATSTADQVVRIVYTARVADTAVNVAGQTTVNSARLAVNYTDVLAGAPATPPNTATYSARTGVRSATLTVVEPSITVAKVHADANGQVDPGELIDFTVTVGNAAGASVAHDVVVTDTVPTSMTPVDGADVELTDGQSVPSGGVWHAAARTLVWDSATVAALAGVNGGTSLPLTYRVRVANPVPAPSSFTNVVEATTTSLAGAATGERGWTTPAAPSASRYRATASVTLAGPDPSIAKAVAPGVGAPGEVVTYTVTVTVPTDVRTYAVVRDTLPAGLELVAQGAATCTAGGVPCAGAEVIGATPLTASGQTIGWLLGSLNAVPVDRELTLTYTARITGPGGSAVDGDTLTNTAELLFEDLTPATPPTSVDDIPGLGLDGSDTASADLDVVEPHLTLAKQVLDGAAWVDLRRVVPGDTVTYRIVLTNDGTATAYDVVVDDSTDARLGTVSNVTGATLVDATAPTLRFSVASIPVGGSVTITYDAVVPALTGTDEVVGPEIVNSALAGYTSLAVGGRPYTTPADTAGLEADVASVGDLVWWDVDRDGVADPGEPGLPGVGLTIVCADVEGVAGVDATFTASTDASGLYRVEHLPACGSVTVTLDPDTLPAGLRTITATPVPMPLSGGQQDDHYDIGVAGAQRIGDLVWYDRDGDGTQAGDGSEPGLAGIGVEVTLCGLDGLPGTADDVLLTATTDASGLWSVLGVPDGCFSVALDPATFPPGLAPVSDPDSTPGDGTADGVMVGADDLTFDFGLRGDARLGDRVWLDADRDGVQDSVTSEPGIAGASVQVTCAMPNGGAPVTVTVVTGADGAYLVDHLPFATCTVAVTALPADLAPTYDEDGGTAAPNGQTSVVLSATDPEHLTADFGYVSDTGVGDTVWWDLDADGVQDAGEPGLGGVEVTVTSGGPDGLLSTTGDNLVVVTTTDATGYYQVLGLPAGETRVQVTGGLPGGMVQTYDHDGTVTPDSSVTTLVNGAFDADQDFGYVGVNSIGDYVWLDLNADRVQDAGEPGLGGVGVDVTWFGPDGVEGTGDDVVLHATTDAAGGYLVDGLPDGDYSVVVSSGVPAGWVGTYDETGPADGASAVVQLGADGPEDYRTADFGYAGGGQLCGRVWLDVVADGVFSPPVETALVGVSVDVTWAGPDGLLGTADDVVFAVVTGSDGRWCVDHMPPGPFQPVLDQGTLPSGTTVVYDRDSGLVSPDGVITDVLAPNEVRTDNDIAVRGTGAFGDRVWVDTNRNGVRDGGEPGANGVTVVATCLGADGVLGGGDDWSVSTVTAGGGVYQFEGLPECRFRVVFDPTTFPRGTTAFRDLDGGDATVTTFDLAAGQVRTDVDLVLRPRAGLAVTGATFGGLLVLALLLTAGGVWLRLRSSRLTR